MANDRLTRWKRGAAAVLMMALASDTPAQPPTNRAPLRDFIASEVHRYAPRMGLPAPPPLDCVLVPSEMAQDVRHGLSRVDWEAAVREAARNVVVRGMSADFARRDESLESATRDAVRDAVVAGLNLAGQEGADLTCFQHLVRQGVEDAMIEAFNDLGDRASDALPRDVRRHYSGPLAGEAFNQRYGQREIVNGGWIVADRLLPLSGGECLLLIPRDTVERVEVWRDGRLVAQGRRYARYFEDARLVSPES